jgi:galactokinase
VALLRALREAYALGLDDVALARLAHTAESEFVGARVGLMDQMVVSVGSVGTAVFLHTRTLAWETVALPASADLVVVDSGVRHALAAGGGYAARRAECARAAALLETTDLCALGPEALDRLAALPAPLDRRVRHVVTEHARVARAVVRCARTTSRRSASFLASHASQRDDYQVRSRTEDCLVELAWTDADVFGARLTGGGFGGAVVILARRGRGRDVAARILAGYARAMPRTATLVLPLTT